MNPPSSDDLLIARLMDLPAEERSAFWQRMCAEHPGLRERSPEVTRLLAASGSAAPAPTPAKSMPLSAEVMVNALESALDPGDREAVGTHIGPYKLLQKIGEGGFGAVWMAEQREPLRRRVALKIIKVGMDTEEVIARFEVERQALALMEHPNIARVFDAGATASGRPYFVMELVRGVPITHYCDENRLSAAARLQLFVAVCQAVQHAHQKGVIHRDLKPSNILVTLHDGTPVPKIIDFGIAKATDKRLTEKTLVTHFHAFVGTPVYTSPEQMEMSGLDVDTRSDIYSLGVLLYELLAGRPPFDAALLLKSGLEAMRRTIREVDPPRPSNRLGTLPEADRTSVAHQRGTDATTLALQLRGDVDWIVMRCLEKDRTRRYDTAAALALDLERYLQHEPVAARPPSSAYRLGKFVRRHRVGVAAVTAVAVSLVGGLVASATLLVRERAARQRAVVAEQAENQLRRQADAARLAEARRASRTSQALAEQLLQNGKTSEGLAHLVRAARSDPENQVIGPRLMAALAHRDFALPVGDPIADLQGGGYDKNGRRMWVYGTDGVVRSWDLAAGTPVQSFTVLGVTAGEQSRDGRHWAVGRADGSVTVLDSTTGRSELGPLLHGSAVSRIVFSPDGRWLATSGSDNHAKLWDAATGELRATLPHPTPPASLAFSPDSRRILTTAGWSGWRIWRVPAGEPVHPMKAARVNSSHGRFSPDGNLVVIADNAGAIVFDAAAGDDAGRPLPHDGPCYDAEFSRDGKMLATASDDATARLWAMPSGQPLFAPLPHGGKVNQVSFTPDGRFLVTSSGDGMARVWDLHTGRLAQETIRAGHVQHIDVAADGSEFLTHSRDHTVRRWRVMPGAIRALQLPQTPDRLHVRVDPDGTDTAWILSSRRLQKVDLLTGRELGVFRSWPVTVHGGILAPGIDYACVHLGLGGLEVWDLRRPELVRHPIGHHDQLRAIRFSPDSLRVAAVDAAASVRVWDTGSGALVVGPIEKASRFFAFSPDSRQIVVAMSDNTATVWDLASGLRAGAPLRPQATVRAVQFSPDGRLIATGTFDATAQLWDAQTRRAVGPLLLHRGFVRGVTFTHDSRQLLTWGPQETRLWDVATGAPLTEPMVGGNDVDGVIFTADESRIATWARTGNEVRLWDRATGQLLADPVRTTVRLFQESGPLAFAASGRFLTAWAGDSGLYVWPVPPATGRQPVPGWLLRLASAVAGGEIDAGAAFHEQPFDNRAFDEVRRELTALPADAPLAAWGRWFLADRQTRPIGPGFKITQAEAEQLAAGVSPGAGPFKQP